MADLPCDLILDILVRLSVRDVVRFRCVSKTWSSLISQLEFVKTHLNRAIEDDNVKCRFLVNINQGTFKSLGDEEAASQNSGNGISDTNPYTTALDFPMKHWSPGIYGISNSCHGMVCVYYFDGKTFLCNPCTRLVRELPKPNIDSNAYWSCTLCYCYDSSIDDYKVVRNVLVDYHDTTNFLVEENSEHPFYWTQRDGIYLNGAVHWFTRLREYMIIPFELATEEFKDALPLPPRDGSEEDDSLGVLGGCLSNFRYYPYIKYELWVMKDYRVAASWTKLFVILEESTPPGYDHYMKPLCFTKNNGLLMDVDGYGLRVYNSKEGRFMDLFGQRKYLSYFSTNIHVETLISPYGNVGGNN